MWIPERVEIHSRSKRVNSQTQLQVKGQPFLVTETLRRKRLVIGIARMSIEVKTDGV